MIQIPLPTARQLVALADYRLLRRTDGWCECLIVRETERWLGAGQDENEALTNALEQMLPSELGRTLLARYLARACPVVADNPADSSTRREGAALPTAPQKRAGDGRDVTKKMKASRVAPASALLFAFETPRASDPASSHGRPDFRPAGAGELPSAPSTTVRAHLDTLEKPTKARLADALDTVERLMREIEDRLGTLARMSAERQRLYMLMWICRARAIEEGMPEARDVEHAVARVARRLTEIGKMFWPGSVRALQLSARPADVRREMHATWATEPADWRQASALADRLLQEHLQKATEAGLDEDGWADGSFRVPLPTSPDTLLEDVDTELKGMLTPANEGTGNHFVDFGNSEFEALLSAARKLRWLRGAVHDDVAWGVAMGRIRRASTLFGERGTRVKDALDARTKPVAPWAHVLGAETDEPAPAPNENLAELASELEAARETKEGLLAWLLRAFDAVNTPDLVALLVPIKDQVADLNDEAQQHADRRVRRRLKGLLRSVAAAAELAEHGEVVEAAVPEPDDHPPVDEMTNHALDALSARVRAQTRGCRALFVSNRDDPELGARLSELLGITITWCDGSLRRVQAQCERIVRGSYDLVLSATGFQVHGVDSALARASSASNIPYVRVNRGRPVACVQAIAREFGLTSGTFAAIGSQAKAQSAE